MLLHIPPPKHPKSDGAEQCEANSSGLKHRGQLRSLRFARSSTHALQLTSVSFGTVSSQPKSSLHNSCRRTLAGRIKGAANPRGS